MKIGIFNVFEMFGVICSKLGKSKDSSSLLTQTNLFNGFNNYYSALMTGLFIGTLMTLIGCYYNPLMTVTHAKIDYRFAIDTIGKIMSGNEQVRDATAVIATQSSSQFGKEFHNNITDGGRTSIIAHPYDKQGSGSSVTISYLDKNSGDRFILLMQKLKTKGAPQNGLKDIFDPIGGYTRGAAVEGGVISATSFEESEARNMLEDKYLENTSEGLNIPRQKSVMQHADKDYISKAENVISQYNAQQLTINPYIKDFNPFDVKKYLKDNGLDYNRDYNHTDTAIREVIEETGYNGIINTDMLNYLYTTDNYGVGHNVNLHTVSSHYVFDLGTLEQAPTIYPHNYHGEREDKSFIANGTEIGLLEWVNIADISQKADNSLYYNDKLINPGYVSVYNNVIRHLRDEELSHNSGGLIISRENLGAWTKRLELEKNQESALTEGEFGQKTKERHQRDKKFVESVITKASEYVHL